MAIKIALIYTTDPLGPKVGGIETFIKGFIKHSPPDFDIQFIGISSDMQRRPPHKWTRLSYGNMTFDFLPLFLERDENKKTFFPLFLRFAVALFFHRPRYLERVLIFNRIEPAIVFKRAKAPKIGFVHNDIREQVRGGGSESLWSKMPWLYFLLEGFIFKSLDYVYTVNMRSFEFYQTKYTDYRDKFMFLPTWVDADIFSWTNESKQDLKNRIFSKCGFLPPTHKWIIFVGRLQEQKAPQRLIDTFVKYSKDRGQASLIIIGEGNLKSDMQDYVKKMQLDNNVFFMGNLKQEDLEGLYRASDLLLLTSNFEGMPRCVLEALGCGLPVVTTDVGEVRRVVKNGWSGEVVESFDPAEISKALEKVLKNPLIYTKENCISCVADYNPQKVLAPVYEKMRQLYTERFGGDAED